MDMCHPAGNGGFVDVTYDVSPRLIMSCHERQAKETERAVWLTVAGLCLIVLCLIGLCVFLVGCTKASGAVPHVIVPPGMVVLSVNNSSPFAVQVCTKLGGHWSVLTNGVNSVSIPMSLLNAMTNPISAWTVCLGWTNSTDPTVTSINIYWGTNSGNYTSSVNVTTNMTPDPTGATGLPTEASVYFPVPGVFYFAATSQNSSGVQSAYSNEVKGTNSAVVPPVTTFFRVVQTNVSAPTATIQK